MSESGAEFGFRRVMDAFDKDETAIQFLREDGEGGFASGVYRMAREIERLRGRFEYIAELEGQNEMTDAKFAEIALKIAGEETFLHRTSEKE